VTRRDQAALASASGFGGAVPLAERAASKSSTQGVIANAVRPAETQQAVP
jgi:hypothetical protein